MTSLQRLSAKAIRYARRLIEFDSASARSNRLIARYLEMKLSKHGFLVERLRYTDEAGVPKYCLVAKKGTGRGGLAWFGHMDTVPATRWHSRRYGPLDPVVIRGRLHGRGSCDMKGAIGCFLAVANSVSAASLTRPLYVVLTADEEIGYAGIRCVVEESRTFREMVREQVCGIIGEPTELAVVHAHKGSTMVTLRAEGIAAHSSTSAGRSATWSLIPVLEQLRRIREETDRDPRWHNREFDPPTLSINVGIRDNAPALNVTASEAVCHVYLRPMPGVDIEPLLERIRAAAKEAGVQCSIPRTAQPMRTDPQSPFVREALALAGQTVSRTVGYGTDGTLLGELANLVVCGPGSIAQAHTENEWIELAQMRAGTALYERMVERWCGAAATA